MSICGIVLAAGAGTRFGGPKALARDETGRPWIDRAVSTLSAAGCAPIIVALGAGAADAALLVPGGVTIVTVHDWAEGLSASVRAALAVATSTDAAAALVIPVDVPELPASACRRVIAHAGEGDPCAALSQATYAGAPGHPVLIGRQHWPALTAGLAGDRGAGPYLRAQGAVPLECGDLWHGGDVDRPRPVDQVRTTMFSGSSPASR